MNKKEKTVLIFQEWLEKVKNGSGKYEFVHLGPNGHLYRSPGFSGEVTDAISCIWDGKGNFSYHEWSGDKPLADTGEITAILKKRERLILSDKDTGYFASGATEATGEDAKGAVIYFRCGGIATLITASSNLPAVQILDYDVPDSEDDPLRVVLHKLLSQLPSHVQEAGVTKNV